MTLDVLTLTIVIGATPVVLLAQTATPAPAQTVTADDLQTTLLSFERAPSRNASVDGNSPPGCVGGTVQGTLKSDTILLTAKISAKILPTYESAKGLAVVLQDEKERKHETDSRRGDGGNPGKSSQYNVPCNLSGPENVAIASCRSVPQSSILAAN